MMMMMMMMIMIIMIMIIMIMKTRSIRREQTFACRVHSESANLLEGYSVEHRYRRLAVLAAIFKMQNQN